MCMSSSASRRRSRPSARSAISSTVLPVRRTGATPSWIKLDNAAKIYPAARSNDWTALFRVSAQLTEPVDPALLQRAQDRTLARFPGFSCRLRRGAFWYYLERLEGAPAVQQDVANPCVRMDLQENGGFMFRTRYHDRRIAVEIFHVLTDGTGGMRFLATMVAEYLALKYGADIPRGGWLLDCSEPPQPEELEDSFVRYARRATIGRAEQAGYRITGTPEERHYLDLTTGVVSAAAVKAKAREYGATVTEFLTALLLQSILRIQKGELGGRRRRMPVKVSVPVNLRRYYPTRTLRNFSSYVNPGVDPRLGDYTLEELIDAVHHFLGAETSEKRMNARFSANVASERNPLLRLAPLVIKDPIMRAAYQLVGDRLASTTFSNLGNVALPQEMLRYVERLDFQLGPPNRNPVCASCVSLGDVMCINFSRIIRETDLERGFFTALVKLGIHVKIESNRRN